jgi:Domain of unknown function (DUF4062)
VSRTAVSRVLSARAIAIQLERIASALERLSVSPNGLGVRRVFLSHTSELRHHPGGGSFIAAAEAAVVRAGHAVADMAYFAARDVRPADYCVSMVARANVYVGVIGHRYGSIVPDQPHQSFTELEFEAATALGMPRLVYLIGEHAPALPRTRQPAEDRARQEAFRRRLLRAGLTVASVDTPGDLQVAIHQSLVELGTGFVGDRSLALRSAATAAQQVPPEDRARGGPARAGTNRHRGGAADRRPHRHCPGRDARDGAGSDP